MADDTNLNPENPRENTGCAAVLSIAATMVLLAALWLMAMFRGFAGWETHFAFHYSYSLNESGAQINLPPMSEGTQRLTFIFLLGGVLAAAAFLFKKQRYSLRRIIGAVLIAGLIGAFPFLVEPTQSTIGYAIADFDPQLSTAPAESLKKRLSLESLAAWRPKGTDLQFEPLSAAELRFKYYDAKVENWNARIDIIFEGESFRRRDQIRRLILDFFEAQVTQTAAEAGHAPLSAAERHVFSKVIER